MSPAEMLTAQSKSLLRDVEGQLDRVSVHPLAAGNALPEIVLDRLGDKLILQRKKLQDLIARLDAGKNVATERESYRNIEHSCRDLFGECLAVLSAGVIRALQLDDGACGIMDKLLRGLGDSLGVPWPHVTAIADAEFFGTASQVIRLRYPVPSIWDFPVAVHEFGHFIGPRWPSDAGGPSGYQDFLDVPDLGPKPHLAEYFADMFATFALGPAYVSTCLLRRFDVACKCDRSHPDDLRRAEWILAGLELLEADATPDTARLLANIRKRRRTEWEDAVRTDGGAPLDASVVAALHTRARALWTSLSQWAPRAGCHSLQGALELRAEFGVDSHLASVKTPGTIRDLLNAAWLLHTDHETDPQKIAEIERWTHTLCLRAQA